MKIIAASSLVFSYSAINSEVAATPILKGASLSIDQGELVAIVGPSGSGKSTLLYLLGLLSAPDSGSLHILGQDVLAMNEAQLAQFRHQHLGFIFQQFHLLPKTSVLENILLPMQYGKHQTSAVAVAQAHEYAELMGLSHRLDHHPNQLSGGQQQRVAICRALMNNPEIILADEPTGNLDSVTAEQILSLLRDLNRKYQKTILIITHDQNVADRCDRIIHMKDGLVEGVEQRRPQVPVQLPVPLQEHLTKIPAVRAAVNLKWIKELIKNFPLALANLGRNKTRTALTMIGISVGIAAVLSMMTLGKYTEEKVLAGYADLGVNTLMFHGYPNWQQKATDQTPMNFQFFDWQRDWNGIKKIFPGIKRISPMLMGWDGAVNFGGRSIDQDVRLVGVSEEGLAIAGRQLLMGRNFSAAEVAEKSGVCLIGREIAQRLFKQVSPLRQVLRVIQGESSYGCRVIGVLKSATSSKEYLKPNSQVYLPFTTYQALGNDWWSAQIKEVMIQGKMGEDVEKLGRSVRAFFELKYGASGRFRVNADSVLVAHMRRFLTLFTVLLASIALVTLGVGGIGITNMMLVSVSERYREIGLRKALGATNREIRTQFLMESMVVCVLAGLLGLGVGLLLYHLAIWGATKFASTLQFEWVIDGAALTLSLAAIILVGLLSGLFPALKAEKLPVIEALRSE